MRTTDKRRSKRKRVLLGARISYPGLGISAECRVRDLSDAGACLVVTSPMGIPNTFDLVFANGAVKPCKVEWRNAEKTGVSFTA